MENLLTQSDTRLLSIIASQTSYYITTDLLGNYTFCNPKFISEFGWLYPAGKIIGSSGLESIMPYHHQRVSDTVMKCLVSPNEVFQVKMDKPGSNDTVKYTLWDFVCLTDDEGKPVEIQCCGIDISDQAEAEKKLEERDMRLRQAQELAHIGSWELDTDTGVSVWSEELCRIFGLAPDQNHQSTALFLSFIHPDDVTLVAKTIHDTSVSHTDGGFYHRIIRPDGGVRYLYTERHFEFDANGKTKGIFGICQDITEIKKAEAELHRSETNLSTIFENTDVGFLFLSTSFAVLAFNKISIQWGAIVFGIELKEHTNFTELLLPDTLAAFHAFAGGILAGRPLTYEASHPRLDKTLMWFTVSGRPVMDKGKVTGICMAITDITARRESEDKITKISNLNAFIGQVNQDIVHIKDKKDLFKNACRIACEFGKFKIAWIGLFDEELNTISLVAQSGLIESQIQQFLNVPYKPGGPQEYLLQKGGYYVSNDTEKEAGLQSWKALGTEFSVRSCMLLAIRKADRVIGTLNLYSTEPGFFDKEKIAMLQEVVSDISFALDMFEKADRQKEAEELVIKNEKRFRALIEKSSDMITLVDAGGKLIYGSPSVSDILGYAQQEFLNVPGFDFIHPDDIPVLVDRRKVILNEPGASFHMQLRLRHKTGTWMWCDDTDTNMLHDPDVNAIVSNFKDITERKNAEDKIRELNDELELRVQERTAELTDANKALEAFSYSVSHDLLAPVRAIKGFSKIILQDYSESMVPDLRELFQYVQDSSTRMGNLINDLLVLARHGKAKLNVVRVNMGELINNIWVNMARTMPNHCKLELSGLPAIYADLSMIEQVLVNLISNAIKYSSKKESPVLKVWCVQTLEHLTFYFKDNGAGFDMRSYHRLFGPFQRLHSVSEYEGTGVGLMLVKRIIEQHGGVVGAEAAVNEGATFYFTLPVASICPEKSDTIHNV